MIDVVIVGYRPTCLLRCLGSIAQHSNGQARVILVCNNKSLATELDSWPEFDESLAVVPQNGNVGWVLGANMGLAMSEAPYVVLMNDDVEILTNGWLEKLSEPFGQKVACIGPHGSRGFQGRLPINSGCSFYEPTLSLDGYGIGRFPISFFCVMFSKAALNEIGLLDERFSPGYADDDDWLARAHLQGWRMAIQTDVQVKHDSGGYDGHRAALQARNVPILREKYKELLASPEPAAIMQP